MKKVSGNEIKGESLNKDFIDLCWIVARVG